MHILGTYEYYLYFTRSHLRLTMMYKGDEFINIAM